VLITKHLPPDKILSQFKSSHHISMEQGPSRELMVTQLLKKCSAFYRTQKLITMFKTAQH